MGNKNSEKLERQPYNGFLQKVIQHENTTMLFVLLLIIVLVFLVDFFSSGMVLSEAKFLTGLNISNVMLQVAVTGIMALGI
ncbi:MAG: hypothetical protein KAH21_09780, partial [Spirochaetaceae bacterium]|nr:hypothetical protein [Spirochaetaceae bacterium]